MRIGVLSDDFSVAGSRWPSRGCWFEIGGKARRARPARAPVAGFRYFSPLLRSLEAQGLAKSQRATGDGRVRRVTLSRKGLREFDVLDHCSQDFATSLLAPLGAAQRERMIAAMAEVERGMRASAVTIEPAEPESADARACVAAYFRELDERFESGFDPAVGAAGDAGAFVPPAGLFLIARLDGRAVGCGALRVMARASRDQALWVDASARGLGAPSCRWAPKSTPRNRLGHAGLTPTAHSTKPPLYAARLP